MSISKLSLDVLHDAEVELTDRDRLALAFGMLREQGWFAPIEWCMTLCCANHGWDQICEHFDMAPDEWMNIDFEDEPPTLWWNSQSDSLAFYGTLTDAVMSPAMEERLDALYVEAGEDESVVAQWMLTHQDELDYDEMTERTTKLVNLVDTLPLNWSGGMERMRAAVEVLRSVGLIVTEPTSPNDRIHVHPSNPPVQVRRRADGCLAVWIGTAEHVEARMPDVVLTGKAAESLATQIGVALIEIDQT